MKRTLLWFRNDLRLADNPALQAALSLSNSIIPVYIHAPEEQAPWTPGAASRWWLHHSLSALGQALESRGSRLLIRTGPTLETLRQLVQQENVSHVYWNRCYEPTLTARDACIKQTLRDQGVKCSSFNSSLLFEPWEMLNQAGKPFRVFTPFWRKCQQALADMATPHPAPDRLPVVKLSDSGVSLKSLALLPGIAWDSDFKNHWTPGEAGALDQLRTFLDSRVDDYDEERDRPGVVGTSRLSPHLHFGEIGPRQILHTLISHGMDPANIPKSGGGSFLRELAWREFAFHLLHHFPETAQAPLNSKFKYYPWLWQKQAPEALQAWQQGRTGIPIVDAGMRELWQTGWMHNRVRMIVASWLTKNLGIHWLEGARWFWDTLLDADLASNTLGWQWTAGCGADAAPFFRIFNPVRQGERFDPQGDYVRRWVPELARLPDKHLHAPWEADAETLSAAGIKLGESYPEPMADLKESRTQALTNWNRIK